MMNGPDILELHPGTACYLSCSFCYRKGARYRAGAAPLPLARVHQLIDEFAAAGGRELYVSGGLEPFSRPRTALAAMRQSARRGLRVRAYTNGVAPALGRPALREALVRYADWVRFSIPALSAETFARVTQPVGRAAWPTAVENFRSLLQIRSAAHRPELGVAFLVIAENAHELVTAGNYWRDAGADFLDVRVDVAWGQSAAPVVADALDVFQNDVTTGRFRPLRVNVRTTLVDKLAAVPRQCWAPQGKLVVDPYGRVWCCCYQSHPGLQPHWAQVGDASCEAWEQIARCVRARLPLPHCATCTPWERQYNHSFATQGAAGAASAVTARRPYPWPTPSLAATVALTADGAAVDVPEVAATGGSS